MNSAELIKNLRDEADLCRNETATDIADLLDDAASALIATGALFSALKDERNALAARVRELEPDAERYRWLRVQRHADIAACWYLPVLPQDYPVDTPEQRDIAIDAARSEP